MDISNTLASVSEQQVADDNNAEGSIKIIFETEIENITRFLKEGNYGLQYISMKRDRFATHDRQEQGKKFETLYHEVRSAMIEKWTKFKSGIEINRKAYYVTEQMLNAFNGSNEAMIIRYWVRNGAFDRLTGKRFAQMASAIRFQYNEPVNIPVVRSIEAIKGLEAERCLFILSRDLAPYLFGEKAEDNKTSHLLYVALTRSLEHLTILITKEVEESYTRQTIENFFNKITKVQTNDLV